jgi:radical SAM protein with 4Fe4S-binding SPASM domain
VQLEVTTKCNLACIMCARDKYHGAGDDLTDDILKPFLDQILPYTQDVIVSSFGEPMLYEGLERIFEKIDPKSGLELGFFTNLLLLTEELAEKIVRSGVAYMNVSIDGASKATYEKIRKGGKWETLVEKIELMQATRKRLKSRTPRMNFCVVGSTLNVEEIPAFVKFAKKHGFDTLRYNHNMYVDEESMEYMSLVHEREKTVRKFREGHILALSEGLHTNFDQPPFSVDFSEEENAAYRAQLKSVPLSTRLGRAIHRHFTGKIERTWRDSGKSPRHFFTLSVRKGLDYVNDRLPISLPNSAVAPPVPHFIPNDAPPRTCGNPWTHMHIKSDGLVYPCCFSDEVMGDLRRQSVEQIWNGEKYQDLRRTLSNGNYWGSCRKASCNWTEGNNSVLYGCEISPVGEIPEIDGQKGARIPVRIRNTAPLTWEPKRDGATDHVSLSYRLFSMKDELIDEGEHVAIPRRVGQGDTLEMDVVVRPTPMAGRFKMKIDMVHEGWTWFGERGNNSHTVEVSITNVPFSVWVSSWSSDQVKRALAFPLQPGQRTELKISVQNTASAPIGAKYGDGLSYHILTEDRKMLEWEGLRIPLPEELAPGERWNAMLPVRMPWNLKTGRYYLELDVVRQNVTWASRMWHRPMLAYPIRVAETPEEQVLISTVQPNGKPYVWEAIGHCVPHTGNKGIWAAERHDPEIPAFDTSKEKALLASLPDIDLPIYGATYELSEVAEAGQATARATLKATNTGKLTWLPALEGLDGGIYAVARYLNPDGWTVAEAERAPLRATVRPGQCAVFEVEIPPAPGDCPDATLIVELGRVGYCMFSQRGVTPLSLTPARADAAASA